MDKILVSHEHKVSVFDSFLNKKLHEIDFEKTYVSCFTSYQDKVLLGTVSGDLVLFDNKSLKTRKVIKLPDAISDIGFDGSRLYLTTHNKTFYVFDNDFNLEKKIKLNLPEFSCLDIDKEVLVGSYDGNVYRYANDNLEAVIETPFPTSNEDSVESVKQSGNKLYLGLVKGSLNVYQDRKKVKEIKFGHGVKNILDINGLLFVSSRNNLYKIKDDEIIDSKTLKEYRTTNFIRNLQHTKIQNKDYLVFLYHDDIHFLDKYLETKFVKLMNGPETVWRIHCC